MTAGVALAAAFFINQRGLTAFRAKLTDWADRREDAWHWQLFLRFRSENDVFFLPMLLKEVFIQCFGNPIWQRSDSVWPKTQRAPTADAGQLFHDDF